MYTSPFFKKFPEIKKENEGKFTAWAKENGFKDACSGASAVMGNKEKYEGKKYKGSDVIEMANLPKTLAALKNKL